MILNDLGDDIRSAIIAEKWLGYLLQHMGHGELEKLLEHYEQIGWISENARRKLTKIAEGIVSSGKGNWQLPGRVHITSLLFIAYLAGTGIPREVHEIDTYAKIFIENPEEMLSI